MNVARVIPRPATIASQKPSLTLSAACMSISLELCFNNLTRSSIGAVVKAIINSHIADWHLTHADDSFVGSSAFN